MGKKLFEFELNPATLLAPRLNLLARLFEKFVCLDFAINFRQATGTTTPGSILVYYEPDPKDVVIEGTEGVKNALNHRGAQSSSVYMNHVWRMPKLPTPRDGYFIEKRESDVRLCMQQKVVCMVETPVPTTTTVGHIHISYTFQMIGPQLNNDAAGPYSAFKDDTSHTLVSGSTRVGTETSLVRLGLRPWAQNNGGIVALDTQTGNQDIMGAYFSIPPGTWWATYNNTQAMSKQPDTQIHYGFWEKLTAWEGDLIPWYGPNNEETTEGINPCCYIRNPSAHNVDVRVLWGRSTVDFVSLTISQQVVMFFRIPDHFPFPGMTSATRVPDVLPISTADLLGETKEEKLFTDSPPVVVRSLPRDGVGSSSSSSTPMKKPSHGKSGTPLRIVTEP